MALRLGHNVELLFLHITKSVVGDRVGSSEYGNHKALIAFSDESSDPTLFIIFFCFYCSLMLFGMEPVAHLLGFQSPSRAGRSGGG